MDTCPRCQGSGRIPWTAPPGTKAAQGSETTRCPRCNGDGEVDGLRDGESAVPVARRLPRNRGGLLGGKPPT